MESESHLHEVHSCGVFCCPCRQLQGDGRQEERNIQAENKKKQNKTKKKATCNGVCYIFNIVDMNNNY